MPHAAPPSPPRWELAAEAIVVKIRWFGLLLGYLAVNLGPPADDRLVLNAILWVSKIDVPKKGVESSVTPDELKANLDVKR